MAHTLVCWNCGASLAELSLPLRRLDECPKCRKELHACRMCVEYDTSKAKHCREPTAEEVREKDRANFCDFFKPREGAYVAPDAAALAQSRAGLDALFGGAKTASAGAAARDSGPPTPAASPAPGSGPAATGDDARAKIEDLFKPRSS